MTQLVMTSDGDIVRQWWRQLVVTSDIGDVRQWWRQVAKPGNDYSGGSEVRQ